MKQGNQFEKIKNSSLKMTSFIFFTHPDSSADESSLSTRREGEEGESIFSKIKLLSKNR